MDEFFSYLHLIDYSEEVFTDLSGKLLFMLCDDGVMVRELDEPIDGIPKKLVGFRHYYMPGDLD